MMAQLVTEEKMCDEWNECDEKLKQTKLCSKKEERKFYFNCFHDKITVKPQLLTF